ncbi:hypothetical protein [Bacteroides nordii]|uniref:hypothetical protein n=1 Tax=Bacteroides nordii TaxID=291645 RepID=UPI0034A4978F
MKNKSLFNIAFVYLCFLFNGCNNSKPIFQDFIGTWTSEDGGEIILRSDSTCVLKNIRDTYIDIISDDKPLNYEGKWILREKDDLEYDKYNIRIEKQGTILIIFYISGERLFGYASPWYLLRYIGDPDELNLYKFTKIK